MSSQAHILGGWQRISEKAPKSVLKFVGKPTKNGNLEKSMGAMMGEFDKIVSLILELSYEEKHPDRVTCIHSALISVNMAVGEEMRRMREAYGLFR